MAEVLQLENYAATSSVDLLSEVKVMAGSQTFTTSRGRVIETFLIRKTGLAGSKADVWSNVRDIEDFMIETARWHEDTLKTDSVWLRRAVDTEGAKRALVYNIEFMPVDHYHYDTLMVNQAVQMYEMAITRHAAYELVASESASKTATTDSVGGTWDASGDLSGGALPGRLGAMRFRVDDPFFKLWAGWRQPRGGFTNFASLIECETASYTTGTSGAVDATASPGSGTSKTVTDFATAATAMTRRVNVSFNNTYATDAECEDQVGRYLVLLRCKVTNSDTKMGAKLVYGFASGNYDTDAPQVHYEIQYIAPGHTEWGFYPMGTIEIPPGGLRQMAVDKMGVGNLIRNLQLRIHTERLEGTGNHDMDCMVLIPADHTIFIDGIKISMTAEDDIWVITNEDDTLVCYIEEPSSGSITDSPAISDLGTESWAYPEGGGLLVVAAERENQSVYGDTFSPILIDDLYKRYLNFNAQ
jgi:hypothetical protein